MCTGYRYDLVCGHQLISYTTRCALNCVNPSGPSKPMSDTCAPCTPSFQATNIQRRYDDLRWRRMGAFRLAQAAGDRPAEARVTAQIARDQADHTAELALIADLRRKLGAGGGQRVVFPGRDEGWEENAREDTFWGVAEDVGGEARRDAYDFW